MSPSSLRATTFAFCGTIVMRAGHKCWRFSMISSQPHIKSWGVSPSYSNIELVTFHGRPTANHLGCFLYDLRFQQSPVDRGPFFGFFFTHRGYRAEAGDFYELKAESFRLLFSVFYFSFLFFLFSYSNVSCWWTSAFDTLPD